MMSMLGQKSDEAMQRATAAGIGLLPSTPPG